MHTTTRITILLAAALCCLTGCNEKSGSKVLARVNGTPLTVEDIEFRLQMGHGKQPQYGDKSIDDIINQELLYQKGVRLQLDRDPGYQGQLAKLNQLPPGAKRLEMARRVFNTQIAPTVDVRFQDAKDYYQKHRDQIENELHLEYLKFSAKSDAEAALKKLRQGANFETVARPVMGTSPVQGRMPWDLGFVTWEQIPVDFVDPIYRLKPGEVSEVLGSQGTGYQIVRVLASRKAPKTEAAQISASVMNRLRDMKLLEAYQNYLGTLRKEAKIVTF
jgi:peptidyl-prolyl cis-trans isomerase C